MLCGPASFVCIPLSALVDQQLLTSQGGKKPFHVRGLFQDLAERFPGAWFMFDTIPRWLSRKTLAGGWKKTAQYTTPKMPWGINRHQIPTTLRAWVPTIDELTEMRWGRFPRGNGRWLFPLLFAVPILNRYAPPVITRVHFGMSKKVRGPKQNPASCP